MNKNLELYYNCLSSLDIESWQDFRRRVFFGYIKPLPKDLEKTLFIAPPVDYFTYCEKYLHVQDQIYRNLQILSTFVFENQINEVYFYAGKSSGKTYWGGIIESYFGYIASLLYDPAFFYGLAKNSSIFIINVSLSGKHAQSVFFGEASNRIKNSDLRDVFPELKIGTSQISFPRNVKMVSGDSSDENWVGWNNQVGTVDEADYFQHSSVYTAVNNLRESCRSRFHDVYFLAILSAQALTGVGYLGRIFNRITSMNASRIDLFNDIDSGVYKMDVPGAPFKRIFVTGGLETFKKSQKVFVGADPFLAEPEVSGLKKPKKEELGVHVLSPDFVESKLDKDFKYPASPMDVVFDKRFWYQAHFDLGINRGGFALVHYDDELSKYVVDSMLELEESIFDLPGQLLSYWSSQGVINLDVSFDSWQSYSLIRELGKEFSSYRIFITHTTNLLVETFLNLITSDKILMGYYGPLIEDIKKFYLDGCSLRGKKDVFVALCSALHGSFERNRLSFFSYDFIRRYQVVDYSPPLERLSRGLALSTFSGHYTFLPFFNSRTIWRLGPIMSYQPDIWAKYINNLMPAFIITDAKLEGLRTLGRVITLNPNHLKEFEFLKNIITTLKLKGDDSFVENLLSVLVKGKTCTGAPGIGSIAVFCNALRTGKLSIRRFPSSLGLRSISNIGSGFRPRKGFVPG